MLDAAYQIADAFISQGLIVSTKGKNSAFDEEYLARSKIRCEPDIPIVVLVDEYSASASEIVAGAIKDTGRGILVGTKTYGKGVVQKRYPITGIGAISLTISSYYTPNGISIDNTGITPHVHITEPQAERIEQMMQRIVAEKKSLEDFVTKWIEQESAQTGKIPTDFGKLEAELPHFRQKLADDGYRVSLRWLTIRTEQLFNINVGIDRIVNLRHDTQLKEAVRLIKADEIGNTIKLYQALDQILKSMGETLQTIAQL